MSVFTFTVVSIEIPVSSLHSAASDLGLHCLNMSKNMYLA